MFSKSQIVMPCTDAAGVRFFRVESYTKNSTSIMSTNKYL